MKKISLFKKLALLLSLSFCFSATACDVWKLPLVDNDNQNSSQTPGDDDGGGGEEGPGDSSQEDGAGGGSVDGGTSGEGTGDGGGTTPPDSGDTSGEGYDITFYVDGQSVYTQTVQSGEKATYRAQNDEGMYEFIGWCTDATYQNFYDFDREVTADVSLYAYYRLDDAQFTNEITASAIKGTVEVRAKTQEVYGGPISTMLGSGVIYALQGGYYYLLTNNHVVHDTQKAIEAHTVWGAGYSVTDYLGTEYTAELLARDPAYDLALLRFKKGKDALKTFEFAVADPTIGQEIVAIGSPLGQRNSITYGKVTGYGSGDLNKESSLVNFDCVLHSAPIAIGSSGGLLMDASFRLIGVNFAFFPNADYTWKESIAVPVTKVKEYISTTAYDF